MNKPTVYQSVIVNDVAYDFSTSLAQLHNIKRSSKNSWEFALFQFLADWFNPEVTHIEQSTSGSTGKPKTIFIEKSKMVVSALNTITFFQLSKGMNALLCLHSNYIGGKMMLVRSILAQMDVTAIAPNSTPIEDLKDDKIIDFAAMVPLQFYHSMQDDRLRHINNLIIGGASVSEQIIQKIPTLYNCERTNIYSTYGMTETVSHIAVRDLKQKDSDYKVLPGIKLSQAEDECLEIFANDLIEPKIKTNDVICFTGETSFIWLGRKDNVINSGGVKIHPEQIEVMLDPIIDKPFIITSVNDINLGDKVVLLIQTNKSYDTIETSHLLKECQMILGENFKYATPKQIFLVSEFAFTPNGKINRKKTSALL